MAIKAILFDLDGTILDTLDDLVTSVNFALATLGFPTRTNLELRAILGNGVHNLIRRALPETATDDDFEKCLAVYKSHYEINKTNTTVPFPGITEAMKALRADGYKLAVISNKHNEAAQGLFNLFFKDYMDFAIGNSAELPKKPAPDMVFHTLEALSVNQDEAIYVGDSEVDIKTAENANLPCIAVTWGFRDEDILKESGAKVIIHSPNELYSTITSFSTEN